MSEQQVYTRNHTNQTDVGPEANNVLVSYLKFIANAVPKIPYSCRFSRVVSRLEIYAGLASRQGEREYKILCSLLHSVCLMCKDWHKKDKIEKDIVHVLVRVRVPREMNSLEKTIDDGCHAMGILPQPRSAKDIEKDEKIDWEILMEQNKSLLSHQEFRDECRALKNHEAEDMMKVMQKILVQSVPDNPDRIHAFKILNALSKQCKRFVTVKTVKLDGKEDYITSGAWGSVSKAIHNGSQVAVKAITLYSKKDNSKAERMLRREILLWDLITQQQHPHILPLIGITDSQFPLIKMVAPWQANGNLSDYVQQSAAAKINRLRLLAQVCSALQHLHNHVPIVIHADLKCANVLVNQDGNPFLADFGLATIRHNGATMTSALEGGSTRWMAPELFMNAETDTNELEDDVATLKVTRFSDIWSFAMLVLELLTDKIPFPDKILDPAVICALIKGERPKHPRSPKVIAHGLNHELWQYLLRCWESLPENRLPLQSLYDVLDKLATQWRPTFPREGQVRPRVTMESMSVPSSLYGRIVGWSGMNIRRHELELDVKINLIEQGVLVKCEITGLPENVEEARAMIQSLVDAQADRAEKSIDVPRHLHRYLIVIGGARIREFQTKHHVEVEFDKALNQAIVRGAMMDVDQAIEELRQTVDVDKEWAPMVKIAVTKRAAQRLMAQRSGIINSTGLDHLSIRTPDESDGHQVAILRGKRTDILDKGQKAIQEICREVQNEAQLELRIPIDQHGFILGPKWRTWSELVLRCGGPEDPKLQQDIIQIDRTSEQVSLRGQPDVINALAKEIQATITRKMPDIYSMLICPRYYHCKDLRRSITNIQYKTKTLILLPGDGKYDDFGDPTDMPKIGDSSSVVKIIGTLDAFTQARMDLENMIRDIKPTLRVLEIPLKYQHAIHERVQRRLREMEVRVSSSVRIEDQKPIRPLANGEDWQVIKRYYVDGVCEWTLRAATKDLLDQAQTLIEKAYEIVRRAKYIGFLMLPDSSRFGRIIGRGGETVQNLQHNTNTTIVVPKINEEDHIIEITGSAQDIEEAKERIKTLVNNDPPSPVDRLFSQR